jgi:hypothetical protein
MCTSCDHRRDALAAGGKPEACRIETTDKATRRFIARLGGPGDIAVCDRPSKADRRCGVIDLDRRGVTSLRRRWSRAAPATGLKLTAGTPKARNAAPWRPVD